MFILMLLYVLYLLRVQIFAALLLAEALFWIQDACPCFYLYTSGTAAAAAKRNHREKGS